MLGAREGAGEGVLAARRWRALKAAPGGRHRRRRLRREPGRRGHHRARAVRRSRLRAADDPSAARDDRAAARDGRSVGRHQLSRRSRSSIGCRSRVPTARRRSSRSWKAAASTARSASCRTRVARKSAGPLEQVMTEVRPLAAQGVREITLLGQNVNAYRGADARRRASPTSPTLIYFVAEVPGIERIRFTTSHPARVPRQPDRGLSRRAEARQLPAPAGAERLGPRARADEARLHDARVQAENPQAARSATGHQPLRPTSSSASPARRSSDFAATLELVARRRFRPELQLHLQPASRDARGRVAGRGDRTKEAGSGSAPAGAAQRAGAARSASGMVGTRPARARRAARAKRCAAARGPHREQPLGQFRRARRR